MTPIYEPRPGAGRCYEKHPGWLCATCGSLVGDQERHDRWHTTQQDPARLILGDYEWRRNGLHLPLEDQTAVQRAFRAGVLQAALSTGGSDASRTPPTSQNAPSSPATQRAE